MKKRLLFCLAAFTLVFGFTNADAASHTYTWSGTSNGSWNVAGNWTSSNGGTTYPGAAGALTDIAIFNTTNITVTIPLTITVASLQTTYSSGGITLSVSSTFLLTINNLTTAQTVSYPTSFTFAGAGTTKIGGAFSMGYQSSLVISSGATVYFLAGAVFDESPTDPGSTAPHGNLTNNGTLNILAGCTLKFGDNSALTNTGTMHVYTSTFTFSGANQPNSIINSGTYIDHGSSYTLSGQGNYISNSGAVASMSFNGATINLGVSGNPNTLQNITNSAAFTADSVSTVTLAGYQSFIKNTGTFLAGTSGSTCTITLSGQSSNITNNTTGTNIFKLGPASVINPSGLSCVITNTSGTFTLQSDITGTATISALGTSASYSGTFNVERYLSGDLTGTNNAYRGYRLLSSPVATSTTSGIYSINYLQTSTWLSGPTGGGFDYPNPGNPTVYLYRDNLKPSNLTFTSGNFRGVIAINVGSSLYTIVGDGNRAINTGNGFLFYDRGSRTNQTTKFTPGAVADPTTLTAIGTLNSGTILVRLWFLSAPGASLDYTSVTGNSAVLGFALIGNPYASSINWDTSTSGGITSSNVGPFTYTLMAATKNYNVYKANTALGVGTIVSTGSNIIPSGQGFFVKAIGNSPSLSFTEAAKTNSQATAALGNSLLGTPVQAAVTPLLHLMLSQDTINKDGILILLDKNAKMQYDSTEDARYLKGEGTVSLSALSSDSVRLAINSTPLPKLAPEVIPLAVNASANGRYQLNMDAVESLPDLFQVWLMDAYKKDSLDIKHNPLYTFDISGADVGSFGVKRFSLVIRQDPALGVHLLNFTATKVTTGSQVVWATENEQNYTNFTVERSTDGITFQVLDGVSSSAQGTYSFLDKSPAQGTDQYRLKIVDLNGTVSYSKIATLMYGNTSAIAKTGIEIYPNPAKGPLNLAINPVLGAAASNSTNSVYSIKIVSSTGAIVQNTTTNSANWQTDVSGLVPGTYVVQVSSNNSPIGHSTFIKL